MANLLPSSSFENILEQQENINNCGICKKEKTNEKTCLIRYQRDEYWDTWIQCDACFLWFHAKCVNVEDYEVLLIKKFHCDQCAVNIGPSQMKDYVCNHRYAFSNESELNKPLQIGTKAFIKNLKKISSNILEVSESEVPVFYNGHDFLSNFNFVKEWKLPYKVLNSDGLGMEMPDSSFDINSIVKLLGKDIVIEVIDVYTQHIYLMSLGRFNKLWKEKDRKRLYNILSLEFSNTPLSNYVKSPTLVRQLSWVNKFWPNSNDEINDNENWTGLNKKNPSFESIQEDYNAAKPCVDNFCLLGMKNSYTDFHIDFGGSSVWYHVFWGEKIFYIVKPTDQNLKLFAKYQSMPNQSEIFFGDFLPKGELKKLVIKEKETLFIPSGWIHAVWTSVDSIVFGGNFLHSLNIAMQLKVYELEELSGIDDRFKFPYFELTNCNALQASILENLKETNENYSIIPLYLQHGIEKLIFYMTKWIKDSKKKELRGFCKTLKELEKEYKKQKKIEHQLSLLKFPQATNTQRLQSSQLVNKTKNKVQFNYLYRNNTSQKRKLNLLFNDKNLDCTSFCADKKRKKSTKKTDTVKSRLAKKLKIKF